MSVKNLNGIEFQEEELQRYMEIGDMDKEKSDRLREKVRIKLTKVNLQEIYNDIKLSLEKDENILEIVNGGDLENIAAVNAIGTVGGYMLASGIGEYKIRKLVFITDRRIFLISTNYYNRKLLFKEYKRSEIVSIENSKEKRKLPGIYKLNLFFVYVFSIWATLLTPIIFVIKAPLYLAFAILMHKSIVSNFISDDSVIIKFKDGYVFELVSENIKVSDLQKYI